MGRSAGSFLGPNGAGKTTVLRMLLGLVRPDRGELRFDGRPAPQYGRGRLAGVAGFVDGPAFSPYLGGRRNHPDGGLAVTASPEALDLFVVALGRRGVPVRSLRLDREPLEAAFLAITDGARR